MQTRILEVFSNYAFLLVKVKVKMNCKKKFFKFLIFQDGMGKSGP